MTRNSFKDIQGVDKIKVNHDQGIPDLKIDLDLFLFKALTGKGKGIEIHHPLIFLKELFIS